MRIVIFISASLILWGCKDDTHFEDYFIVKIGDSTETVYRKLIGHGIDTSSITISPALAWKIWTFHDSNFMGHLVMYDLLIGRGKVKNIKVWLEKDNNETFELLRTVAKKSFADTIEVWNFLGDSGTLVAAQDSLLDVKLYKINRDSLGPHLPLILINSNARTISGIKPKSLEEIYGPLRNYHR